MAVTVMLVPGFLQLAIICLVYGGGLIFIILFSFWHNLWVDAVLPASALALAFSISTAFSYATEGRQRRQIKHMFSRYMSDLLIQDLLRHPEKLRLGGEKRLLTVFFSDLAGFTTVSEKLLPEEVVTLLNRYLTAMTDLFFPAAGSSTNTECNDSGSPLPRKIMPARLAARWIASSTRRLTPGVHAHGPAADIARIGISLG
jgi:adenylate cyclase